MTLENVQPINMSYKKYEMMQKQILDSTDGFSAGGVIPDFGKVIEIAENKWELLKYLIWYINTAEGTDPGVLDAIDEASDYIDSILQLHK